MTALKQHAAQNETKFAIREERASDVAAREALLDVCFGPKRHARTCQKLRSGRRPAEGLAFSAMRRGHLIGTVRLWRADAGGRQALVLGPLAVDPLCRELGIGGTLVKHALAAAKALGHGAVILLGDEPYYTRFGFSREKAESLSLPGLFERHRLLGLELHPGALNGAFGLIVPNGAFSLDDSKLVAPLAHVA